MLRTLWLFHIASSCLAGPVMAADKPLVVGLWPGKVPDATVHILDLPGECLVDYRWFAQRAAPRDFVAVAAYTDLGPGYVCTDKTFAEGGYEPTDTAVGPGSEPLLKAAILKLLGGTGGTR